MKRAFVLLLLVLLAASGCGLIRPVTIQENQIGVLTNSETGELLDTLYPGRHLIEPGPYDVAVYQLGTFMLQLTDSPVDGRRDPIDALTLDGETIHINVTILYSLNPLPIGDLHTRYQGAFIEDFIDPTLRAQATALAATFSARDLFGEKLVAFEITFEEAVSTALAEEGIILVNVLINYITFSEEFTSMIEQTIIAEVRTTQTAEAATPEAQSTPTP